MIKNRKYLVTGAAGFIGFYVVQDLLKKGFSLVGIDNLNDYYDVALKNDRLAFLKSLVESNNFSGTFEFIEMDISNRERMTDLFQTHTFDKVIHLAAQAGVRYSIENPHACRFKFNQLLSDSLMYLRVVVAKKLITLYMRLLVLFMV